MTYREDTAALRAKIGELERELASWEKRFARVDEVAGGLGAQAERLATLERRRGVELPRWALRGAMAFAVVTLAAGIAFYVELEDVRRDAANAYSTGATALGQANAANQNGASAYSLAQQALARPMVAAAAPNFDQVVRPGTVEKATGEAPVAEGDSCTVTVAPAASGPTLNCRVVVRCGGRVIYGGPGLGYLACSLDEGQPTFGRDEEPSGKASDPKLELDLTQHRVVVSDGPDPEYVVTIALPKP